MILSKIDSLYRQPNLFRLFLSTSSVLEHELKTHISDVLKTVYLLLVQIGCFYRELPGKVTLKLPFSHQNSPKSNLFHPQNR